MPESLDDLIGTLKAEQQPRVDPVAGLLADSAAKRRPWEQAAADLADLGVDAKPFKDRYAQVVQVEQTREAWRQNPDPEDAATWWNRRAVPFASAVAGAVAAGNYQKSLDRFKAGELKEGDAQTIAQYERLQQKEKDQSLGAFALSSLAKLPALAGEAAVAGPVGRGLFGLAGRAAPATAARLAASGAPIATTAGIAPRAAAAELGKAALGRAATTPLMPSLYAEQAAQNALQNGGNIYDFKNAAPALALAAINNITLGSLGPLAKAIPGGFLRRVAGATAIGLAEQQAADVATSGIDDVVKKASGYTLGLNTRYGVLGSFLRGDDDAAKHLVGQLVTFGAFAALHAKFEPVADAAAKSLDAMHAAGVPRAEAAAEVSRVLDAATEATKADPAKAAEAVQAVATENTQPLADVVSDVVAKATEPPKDANPPGWRVEPPEVPESAQGPVQKVDEVRQPPESAPGSSQAGVRPELSRKPSEGENVDSGRTGNESSKSKVRLGAVDADRVYGMLRDHSVAAGRSPEMAESVVAGVKAQIDALPTAGQKRAMLVGIRNVIRKGEIDAAVESAMARAVDRGASREEARVVGEDARWRLSGLTERERHHLGQYLATGSYRDVGKAVGKSQETVRGDVTMAAMKLGDTPEGMLDARRATRQGGVEKSKTYGTGTRRLQARAEEKPTEGRRLTPEEARYAENPDSDLGAPENLPIEVAPGVVFRRGPSGNVPSGQTGTPAAMGPFEIVKSAFQLFNLNRYIGRTPDAAPEAYLEHVRTLEQSGMAAGDLWTAYHGIGHHIATEKAFESNPANLPAAVRDGLKEFDYDPARPMGAEAMKEGFAEWVRRRTLDDLQGMTPEQQIASQYAEQWVHRHGFAPKLNRVRDWTRAYSQLDSFRQAQGEVSPTGDPATPAGLTQGERSAKWLSDTGKELQDAWEDRWAAATRMEAAAQRTGGAPSKPGQGVRDVIAAVGHMGDRWAQEFAADGAFTFRPNPDGSWTKERVGKPVQYYTEGFAPADLTPGGWLDTFIQAHDVMSEVELGQQMAQSPNARTREEGAKKLAVVAPNQIERFRTFLEDAEVSDRGKFDRGVEAARRYTELANATNRILIDTGFTTAQAVAAQEALYPTYVSKQRVIEPEGGVDRLEKGRHGSGRQLVAPSLLLRQRYDTVGKIAAKQLIDNALYRRGKQSAGRAGVEGFWVEAPPEPKRDLTPDKQAEIDDALLKAGVLDPFIRGQMIQTLGPQALAYAQPEPWSHTGINRYLLRIDGKPIPINVADRASYEILTGQQNKTGTLAPLANKLAQFPVLGQLAAATRFGATSATMVFPVRNVIMDVPNAAMNVMGSRSPLKDAAAFLGGHKDSVKAKVQQLAGWDQSDPQVRLYFETLGEDARAMGFAPRGRGEEAWRKATGQSGTFKEKAIHAVNTMKDVLEVIGAGEHGPRIAEWKRALDDMGYTRQQIEQSLAATPNEGPVPTDALFAARHRAANATVDFQRQGAVAHELNKVIPFFGAHIAALSKEGRNFNEAARDLAAGKLTPKAKAVVGVLATYLTLEAVHHFAFQDEEWYKNLDPHQRYDWWIMGQRKDGSLWGVPKPRGLLKVVGAYWHELLRSDKDGGNAFGAATWQAAKELAPQVLPVGAQQAKEIIANEDFAGRRIVPRGDEYDPEYQKWADHRAPYLVQQLSGGLLSGRALRTPEKAFRASSVPAAYPIDQYYERYVELDNARTKAMKRGERFADEAEYQRLNAVHQRMTEMNRQARGEVLVGGRVRLGTKPTPERVAEIRSEQNKLAKRALLVPAAK